MTLSSLLSDAEDVIARSPEELGCALLKVIESLPQQLKHRTNYLSSPDSTNGYPDKYRQQVKEAQNEAWEWLRSQGYILPLADSTQPEFIDVTRKGREYLKNCSIDGKAPRAQTIRGQGAGGDEDNGAPLGAAPVQPSEAAGVKGFSFSPTVIRIFEEARRWMDRDNILLVRVSTSRLLFAIADLGGDTSAPMNVTTGFFNGWLKEKDWEPYAEARKAYEREHPYALKPAGPNGVTENAEGVLRRAQEIADLTTSTNTIHARHLLAGLLTYRSSDGGPVARKRLEQMKVNLAALQRDFRDRLRRYPVEDDQAAWDRILLEGEAGRGSEPTGASVPDKGREGGSRTTGTTATHSADALIGVHYEDKPPSLRMLADAPLDNDTADRLGFKAYARALAGLINSPDTSTPLTLAINAPWGAGKTTLALMVERILKRSPAAGGTQPHVTCWFNAWMHDDAPSLASAFAAEVAQTANCARPWWRRFINPVPVSLLPISRRRRWLPFLLALVALLGVFCAAEYWYPAVVSHLVLSAALLGITALTTLATMVQPLRAVVTFAQSLAEFVKDPKLAASSASMKEVSDQLRELIEQATPKDSKFVIFIDDLERCRPPRSVDVLEVVNQLLCHKRLVTVIIGDMPAVVACAAIKYKDLVRHYYAPGLDTNESLINERRYGREYLQKIVQLQFDVPVQSPEDIHALMESLLAGPPSGAKAAASGPAPALRTIREKLGRLWARQPEIDATRRTIDAKIDEELRAGKENLSDVEESVVDSLMSRTTTEIILEDLISERIQRRLSDESEVTRLMKDAGVMNYVQPLPRHAKRLLNRLRLLLYVAHERRMFGGDPPLKPEHLAKWAVLCERWPDLAEGLVLHPSLMVALERKRADDDDERGYTNVLKNLSPACAGDSWLPSFLRAPDTDARPGVQLAPVMRRIVRFEPATPIPQPLDES